MSSFLSLVSFSLNSPSNRCAVYTKLDLKTWPAFLWVFIFSVVISRVKSIKLRSSNWKWAYQKRCNIITFMDYDAGIRVTYCMWFINLDAQPSHPSRVDVQWSPTPTTNAARCQTVSTPLPWCHTAPAVLSMVRIYLPHRDPPAVEPEVRKICVTPNLLKKIESPPNFPFGQTC